MNVVGKFGTLITKGVYSVATPFHPFGGAVDVIVVQQQDGTFRSTPWYVRFGKFQGVLKRAEKIVKINVNGVEANFHMYLDNSGEAYFVKEVDEDDKSVDSNVAVEGLTNSEFTSEDGSVEIDITGHRLDHSISDSGVIQLTGEDHSSVLPELQKVESDVGRRYYDFEDDQPTIEDSADLSEYGENVVDLQGSNPEVILVSVDGHILTAPISELEPTEENLQSQIPQFHLGPGEGTDFYEGNEEFSSGENARVADYVSRPDASTADVPSSIYSSDIGNSASGVQLESCQQEEGPLCHTEETGTEEAASCMNTESVFKSCLDLNELALQDDNDNLQDERSSLVDQNSAEESNENCSNFDENAKESMKRSRNIGELSSISGATSSDDSNSPNLKIELQGVDKDASVEVDTGSGIRSGTNDVEWNDSNSQETTVLEIISEEDNITAPQTATSNEGDQSHFGLKFDISLCGHELKAGMGFIAAAEVFEAHRISAEEFRVSAPSITKNKNLVVKFRESYLPWEKAAPLVLGVAAFDLDLPVAPEDTIPVGQDDRLKSSVDNPGPSSSGRRWRLWPLAFRKVKTAEHNSGDESSEDIFLDSESDLFGSEPSPTSGRLESPRKQFVRTNVPSNEMIASLNLKDGQNMVTFSFSTRVLGTQQVDAHIYLWKWNARIVISDVDGTITKSDVLGQFMPLVGKDWNQTGVARLFSAIKENGYQLLFLSARAIVQAYITRNFLVNLKQDGKTLPKGPVVISPDGLFPSLYREVIKRAPHEFKIACLEDIKRLFPSAMNLRITFPRECNLQNLKILSLEYCKSGEVLFPKSVAQSLQQLEQLKIRNCHELKLIIAAGGREHGCCNPTSTHFLMSSLREVTILDCPMLESIFPICYVEGLAELKRIHIAKGHELKYIFGECDHEHHSSHQYLNHTMLPQLEVLKLSSLDNLIGMCPEYCHAKWPSHSLRDLVVEDCPKLDMSWIALMIRSGHSQHRLNENLPLKLELYLHVLPQLKSISWQDPTAPSQIWSLQCLQYLKVGDCENLKSLFSMKESRSLPELMSISIYNSQELEHIVAENEELVQQPNAEVYFPKLAHVEVKRCNKLKSLFPVAMVKMLPQLSTLHIFDATQFEEVFRNGGGHITVNEMEVVLILPNLTEITLNFLPSFVHICQGCKLQAVKLQQINIYECPKIAPSVKEIQVRRRSLNAQ